MHRTPNQLLPAAALGLLCLAFAATLGASSQTPADPFSPITAQERQADSGPEDAPPPDGPVHFVVDVAKRHQTVHSFGASDAWMGAIVGGHWPDPDRSAVARLLFSTQNDENGQPEGIGLSAWRFYIGAGSFEQGEASGIAPTGPPPEPRRTEGFLNADGTYDWSKQAGQRWLLQAAKAHGVRSFIGFSVSPPVHYTRNGLATSDGEARANLKEEHFGDFAAFLATVTQHFRDREGIEFEFLSPLNEPQWKWAGGRQEGSPWTNAEIARIARLLDSELTARGLATKVEVSEAGTLLFVMGPRDNHADDQARTFFDPESDLYLGNLPRISRAFAAHGYFNDGRPIDYIGPRKRLKACLDRYGLQYAMTEYCLLRTGLDKTTRTRPIPPIDSAMQLARIIHADLVHGGAVTWQFWTAMDTQKNPDFDLRYYLIETSRDRVFHRPTKLLWSLGHYSRFIRPGYLRLETRRSDDLDEYVASDRELLSAFLSPDGSELVCVLINWRTHPVPVRIAMPGLTPAGHALAYVTTSDPQVNLRPRLLSNPLSLDLDPRSLTTVVIRVR